MTPLARRLLAAAGLFASFAVLSLLVQVRLGAGTHEFTSDDANHYVTMVVLRNLVLGGHLLSPVGFLVRHFEHYQMLGLGLWPPGYHMAGAAWTAVFSSSRASVMAFQGCLGAGLAAAAALAAWRPLGPPLAVAAGVGTLLSPLMLPGLAQLQADVPTALAMFLAALAFWRLMERGGLGDGLLFGLAALVAIMTKGNAIALALLPPFAVLLTGRWALLRRPGFWVPALVILPVAGPWYVLTYSWTSAGFRYTFGTAYTGVAAPFIAGQFLEVFGALLLLLAAVAALDLARRRGGDLFTAAMLALVLATVVFQAVVPAALEPRYLTPVVAPMLLLAARGAWLVAAGVANPGLRRFVPPSILAAGAAAALLGASVPTPPEVGARILAEAVRRHLPVADPVALIASDALVEGALTCEMVMQEGLEPRGTLVRGSRLLGGGGYNNFQYEPRFATPEQAMDQVDRLRIPMVVMDRGTTPATARWTHIGQLADMLDRPGAGWSRAERVEADGRTYDLFLRAPSPGPTDRPALARLLRPGKGPKAD